MTIQYVLQEAAIKDQLRAALGAGVAALAGGLGGQEAGPSGTGPSSSARALATTVAAASAGASGSIAAVDGAASEGGIAFGGSAAKVNGDGEVQDLGVIRSKRVRVLTHLIQL